MHWRPLEELKKLYDNNIGQFVIFEAFGNRLHITDIMTLLEDSYINAYVLDAIFKSYFVQSQANFVHYLEINTSKELFTSNSGRIYADRLKLAQKLGNVLQTKKVLITPVHSGYHSVLLVIDFNLKTFTLYNSLKSNDNTLMDMCWINFNIFLSTCVNIEKIVKKSWKMKKGICETQRRNCYDCGLHTIANFREYLENSHITNSKATCNSMNLRRTYLQIILDASEVPKHCVVCPEQTGELVDCPLCHTKMHEK